MKCFKQNHPQPILKLIKTQIYTLMSKHSQIRHGGRIKKKQKQEKKKHKNKD